MKNIIALTLVSSAVPLFAVTVGDQDVSVEFYTPRTVRVLKTPAGATFSKPFETVNAKPGAVSVKFEGGETATWSSDALVVKLDKNTRLVSFWTPQGERIFGEKENAYFHHVEYGACKAMRVNQCFEFAKDEGLYGLGDLENGRLNQRGEKNTLTPRNVGDGIPYVASNRGWALCGTTRARRSSRTGPATSSTSRARWAKALTTISCGAARVTAASPR